MRRAFFVVVGAVVAAVLPVAAARADTTVVVRGLGFAPGSPTSLAVVGCSDLYATSAAPVTTYLSLSPGGPAGSRALAYQLDGDTAVGSQHRVRSLAATTVAGLSVQAAQGTTGVAYVGYQSPQDAGTTLLWVGRATLTVAPGWQHVEAPGLTYTWTKYDFATRQSVPSAADSDAGPAGHAAAGSAGSPTVPATVPAFLATHGGDGPGFYALGFGCDGSRFKVDALQTGTAGDVTTYDLEGYATATGISGSATRITAGDRLTLEGTVSTDLVGPVDRGLLVLEARGPGQAGFRPVDGAALEVSGGGASATVEPTGHTVYRWHFGGTSSAEESVSSLFTVDVASAVTAAPDPTPAGRPVAVAGTVVPARPGLGVTLWRAGADGPTRLASATTGPGGAYRIAVPDAQPDGWRYFVTVAADDAHLAGRSPVQDFPAR